MRGKTALRAGAYILFFLLMTALFVPANLPPENVTAAVNHGLGRYTDGRLTAGAARFSLLPPGLAVTGLRLALDDATLEAGRAFVSPSLPSLLTGGTKAGVSAEGDWGSVRLALALSADGWALSVREAVGDLRVLADLLDAPVQVTGGLRCVLHVSGSGGGAGSLNGDGRVTAGDLVLSGGLLETLDLPALTFTEVSLFFSVTDNLLTVGENSFAGNLAGGVRGTVRLTPSDLSSSRLDLSVSVKPSEAVRERLSPVFSLLGLRAGPDGVYEMRIRGTVGRPTVSGIS